ncbi:uncharacterized protein V1516DRAFT_669621 [Lipomyces oligophaga]|uniref:uncharacterized protein n=1 Tax=Lipomyces oligophaga TaxID=45792 RepID=UPI0034CFD972
MPLIETINSKSKAGAARPGRKKRIPGQHSASVHSISAQTASVKKALVRHLQELEKDGYNDNSVKIEIPRTTLTGNSGRQGIIGGAGGASGVQQRQLHHNKASSAANLIFSTPSVTGRTPAIRKLISSKKVLSNLLDEDNIGAAEIAAVTVGPSRYPGRHICSVCGYWGPITCIRCSARYCSMACEDVHRETRCLKVYA